jgi:hypothetical protein
MILKKVFLKKLMAICRRKAQFEAEKLNSGHHTLTLGKLGKKK